MDQEIEGFRRIVEADPEDQAAGWRLLAQRARTEGSEIYLEVLSDRLLWNRCPEAFQDLAISEVDSGLGEAYEHLFTKVYSCSGQSHRIATLKHIKTGCEVNLIPGGRFMMGGSERAIDQPIHEVHIERPFLLGRFPLRQREWDLIGGQDQRNWSGEDLPIEGALE